MPCRFCTISHQTGCNIQNILDVNTWRGKILRKNIDEIPELFSSIPQSPQISAVYDDIEELTELLAIYFKQGIEKGEYCLWISPDEMAAEKAENELKKSGVDRRAIVLFPLNWKF